MTLDEEQEIRKQVTALLKNALDVEKFSILFALLMDECVVKAGMSKSIFSQLIRSSMELDGVKEDWLEYNN